MPKLHYGTWKGYKPSFSSLIQGSAMPQYDPSRFIPRPVFNEKTGKWDDLNAANRKQNNWPAEEVARTLQEYKGYGGLSDIAINPHPIPKGAAGPEKFATPQDFERAQTTFQAVQGSIRASGGVPSTEAALGVTPINKALREGRLPIRIVGQAANTIERMQQEGKRTEETHKQQLLSLGQKGEGETAWEMIEQKNLPNRETLLKAYHQAQPAVQSLQRRTMVNASKLIGQPVPRSVVNKFIPALSHQQLGFVQSKSPMKAEVAGPGGGKTAGLVAAIVDQLVNRGMSPEAALEEAIGYIFLSQTKSAGTTMGNMLQGIEQLVPGWDAAQRATQIGTFAHFGMSQLNKGQRSGSSLMQKMGLGHYKPVYGGESATIEEEQAKRAHEQVLARVFEHHGLDKRVNNIGQLTQSIAEVKGTTRQEIDTRMAQGRKQFASLQWKQDKIVSPDMALYLYQQALHAKPGFTPKGGPQGPTYDINDVPRLLLAASEHKNVTNFPQFKNIVVDESQDTSEMMTEALTRMRAKGGRILAAGDAIQQAIQRPWDFNRAFKQQGAALHPQEINFRTGRYGVETINPLLATSALAGRPRSPFQVAFKEQDTPTQYRVEKDFPTTYQAMFKDWMRDMGLTPKMMAQSMQEGQSPFEQATTLPMEAPFVFQRGQEGRDAFLGQVRGMIGKHMSPDMVNQFFEQHVSTESPSVENVMKMHALTMGGIRGETVHKAYIDATQQGLWDKPGYAGQLYTMMSRASEQSLVYGSMTPGKGQVHDLTPGYIGGQEVPHGFDQLIAAGAVGLVNQQGMRPEDLSPFMQGAYAQGSESGQSLADPEAIKQFAEMALFMEKSYSSPVGSGAGILEGDQGAFVGAGFSVGDLTARGTLNQKVVVGQTKESAISASKMTAANRLSHEMIMNGAPQIARGKATLGPAGEILAEPLHLQSQREAVPSHEEFMAHVHQAAGPIDAKILMDPIEREAGSVFEEIDNVKMKPWAGNVAGDIYETGDITNVRKFAQASLSSSEFRDIPAITSQLEKHLTHPKVLAAAQQKIQELARANPRLAKGLRQRKSSLKPLEWDSESNDWASQSDLSKFQDLAQKHVLSKKQQLGLEDLQKQQSLDLNARGEGGLQDLMRQFIHPAEGNKLYHPEMKNAIYGAASKVLPWKRLDPQLIGFMGKRAADFAQSPIHTEKQGFWDSAAKSFEGYAAGLHESGAQLSWHDLDRIGKRDPMQARLLENIFGDKKTGEMLPYTHPDVKRAVNEFVYRQGQTRRSISSVEEGTRLRYPLQASKNAPTETELGALHSALEGGNWEGHGAGAADSGAVIADPSMPGVYNPIGSGAPLHSQEQRYRELANNPHMSAKKRAGFQEQLDLVSHVRSQFGDKTKRRDWAHTLQAAMYATTGESPRDSRTGKDYEIDPIRKWFRNRDANMPDARSLPKLAQLGGALDSASQHLQKTGTLKRSHIDDILQNFGFDPKDKRFTALRKLEKNKGFRRDAGTDPELSMQGLISEFPGQSGNLQSQLTRAPMLFDTSYTYMGGQPGFASVKGSQKDIPSGIEGTLHPIKDSKGKELPFGISNVNQMHMAHKMFSKEDLAVLNPTRAPRLPDDVARQQNTPLFEFRGTHHGKDYTFPVNSEQLALTDPARAKSAQGIKDVMQSARWTGLRWKEQDKNKEEMADLVKLQDEERHQKRKSPSLSQGGIAERRYAPLDLGEKYQQIDPHAAIKAQIEASSQPEETVYHQGRWMPKGEAARLKDQEIASRSIQSRESSFDKEHARLQKDYQLSKMTGSSRSWQEYLQEEHTFHMRHPETMAGKLAVTTRLLAQERPMGESYRGYELGPDITRAVVDKIIASKESAPVSPPEREAVDSRQKMLPGFGGGKPPVPPTPPIAPMPQPEGEERGIPSPTLSNLHQKTPAPLSIEGRGFSASMPAPHKEPALISQKPPIISQANVAKQLPAHSSLQTKGSWDNDPYGFPPEPPAQDYYGGPSEEEMPALQSFLNDVDKQKSGPVKIQGKPPASLPQKISATPVESQGIPFDISDLPGLMRSPHRMQVRDGMIHHYDPSKGGIAVGGLAREQREALEAKDQHLLLQGGPGTGKTDVGVMRAADFIASGQVAASKTLSFSGMHSGVEEINARFNKFLRPLLPARERDQLPMARTIHSVANQIMFPGGNQSPVLQDMGLGWAKGIMANPSEEELAQQTPETATDMRDEQYRFLRDAMQQALPHASHLFQTKAQLDPILKNISKYKSDRSGKNSLYEQKMVQGQKDISAGKFTHAGALSAYEQAKPAYGKIDFHDQIHIARQMLEHSGEKGLPEDLKGTQMVMYDEAQDSNRENTALISQLVKTLGPETKSIIGLDPLQSLFQGAGSVPGDKIIPSFREALGGEVGHVQLRENFRSSKKDTALANSILQMKAMKGKKELSPLQNPHSQEWGHDPKFLLAKSQPNLYKQMFSSMLGHTGVSTDTIKENILKGAHPFEGVDWEASGMTKPGEIPAIFMTHAQTDLFGATAPKALEGLASPGKISPKMARDAFAQIHRAGLPGKFASKEEREGYDEKSYFRSLMVGQSRGLAFQYPHSDVTVAGGWRKPGPATEESYLHNLGVQVSRVKSGGQNIIASASHVLDSNQTKGYIATGGRHFREEQPTSLSQGRVWFGPGPDDHLKVHPKNEFETHEGQAVPPHFKEIMGLQAKAVADWKAMLSSPAQKGKATTSASDAQAQPIQNAKITIAGNTTIQTPPNGKVTVAGSDVQVDIVKSNTPLSPNVGIVTPTARQSNIGAAIDALGIGGGSSFISPLGAQMQRGGPLSQGGPIGFNGAPARVVGSTPQDHANISAMGGPQQTGGYGGGPPKSGLAKLSQSAENSGRTLARVGGEMEFFGKLFDTITDKAVQQGSDYRKSSTMFASSGPTGDQGFFNFPQSGAGITQMQTNSLPMYSKTEIAKNLIDVASMTGGTSIPSGTSTNVMQLAALTGMDPTQLTSQLASISGSGGQGMSMIPALEGNIGSLYKGQVTASNLEPTLQAVQSAFPAMQGVSFGQGNQMQDLFGLMGAAQSGGMTAANMPDVSNLVNSLTQVGTAPNLNQQAALSTLFPGQGTANPQLAEFQQQQVGMSEQAAQIGLQQQFNVPGLQMQIGNANVAMQQANIDMGQIQQAQGQAQIGLTQQQLGASQADLNYQQEQHVYQQSSLDYQKQQLKYSEAQLGYSQQQYQYSQAQYGQAQLSQQYAVAQFQQQQYVATAEYGPIGGNTGRQSYFDFMRNQQAAGYNPLSAETGTQFQASNPQGIQNMQFYAGIEHQRQDMVLSRSPLLSDAKFQEDMKYLNEQEAFYKEQLDLTNEQRKFEVDWGGKMLAGQQKLIDMQGPLLATQGKLLAMQQPLLNAQGGLLKQQQGLLNSSENLLNLQQGILDTQKGMLIYTKEELDAQANILGIQQTQVGLTQQMNAYNEAQLKLQQDYLPKELAALQAVQVAMQQQISGQGPVNGGNVTPQQIIEKLSLITDPTQQQNTIRNLGISPTDTNTLMKILGGIKTEGGYAAAMSGTNPADKSIQADVNKLIKSGAFTAQTSQAAQADESLNLGGTGDQWNKFVAAYTDANTILKDMNTKLSWINNSIKWVGTLFAIGGPVLTGIGMLLQGFGIGGKVVSWAANGGVQAAATGAGSWLTDTAIPAAGGALTTIAPFAGPAASIAGGLWAGANLPIPGKGLTLGNFGTSVLDSVVTGILPSAGLPLTYRENPQIGQGIGNAWNGIKSGASSTWNWLTTPFGSNQAEAAPAPTNPKGHDFGAQPNTPVSPVIPAPPSTSAWSTAYKNIVGIFAPIGKTFQGYWNTVASGSDWLRTYIRGKIGDAWNFIITTFSRLGKWFGDRWVDVQNVWKAAPGWIHDRFQDAWNRVTGIWTFLGKWFGDRWKDVQNIWNAAPGWLHDKMQDAWNRITGIWAPIGKTFQGYWNDIMGGVNTLKTNIYNKWTEIKTDTSNIFHDMINGIVDHLNDGLKGFATFINFFGQNLDDLEKLLTGTRGPIPVVQFTPIPHYAQGTGEHPGGLAVVGEKGRELVSLPKGAQVASNDITELFLKMTGGNIPGYASGIGDLASQITGWVTGGAQSILDNVMKSLHITAPKMPGLGSLSSGIFDDLKKWAVTWITSVMPSGGGGGGSGSATPVNVPGNVASWIQAAMALTHVPANWLGPLETIAMHESGGNPNSINNWDINALEGHPSQGLFQTIPGTFMAHALSGHTNILNPIDNAAAAIGYIQGRYGDVFHVPGIVSMSQGGAYVGYGKGGIATVPQIANVAEREPEAIIPLSKLSTILNNLSSTSVTTQTPSQPSSGKTIHVGNLIGSATFAITNTGGSQLDEKAQDDLMHQVLSLIEAALQDKNGKMS